MKSIPVIFVCWNRVYYIEQALFSYLNHLDKYSRVLKLFVYSQGSDQATLDVLETNKKYISNIKVIPKNEGFGTGISKAFEWVKEQIEFDYFILLEDDWFLAEPLNKYLGEITNLLDEKPDIGCIRLRNIAEKVNQKNRVSGKRVEGSFATENIYVGNYHYTTNPHIMRKDVMKKLIPFEREVAAMIKYNELNLLVGQLHAYCFSHIGIRRSKGWKSGINHTPVRGNKRGALRF
jgi:GT2 family glycosyltransferase